MEELGWVSGATMRYERSVINQVPALDDIQKWGKELVGLAPDALLVISNPLTEELAKQTQQVPIIFVIAADPVGADFATSLARPTRNITDFTSLELEMGVVQFLKDVKPSIQRMRLMWKSLRRDSRFPRPVRRQNTGNRWEKGR